IKREPQIKDRTMCCTLSATSHSDPVSHFALRLRITISWNFGFALLSVLLIAPSILAQWCPFPDQSEANQPSGHSGNQALPQPLFMRDATRYLISNGSRFVASSLKTRPSQSRCFDFWLTKLNQFGGNFRNAEMV